MVGFILTWFAGTNLLFFFFPCCIMERSKHGVWDFVLCMSLARALLVFWVCGQLIFERIFFGVVVGLGSGWSEGLSISQCNHIQPHFLSHAD
jgi:hypothetical protein